MTPSGPSRRSLLFGLPAALAGGCTASSARPAALTREEERSLATLRVVDPRHPLLAMTRYGTYDALKPLALARTEPFACSLFLAAAGPRGPLFGRNFDWGPNAALLLTSVPPKGPVSISLVDVSYLGVDPDSARRAPRDAAVGRRLLDAVKIPFDGVNEHGLAIGLAAVPSADPPEIPGRPVVGSARVQRLVLDRARTVDQAVEVFHRHTVEFGPGEVPLHYLMADASGKAAVVEFVAGKVQVVPGADTWHDMVNFVLSGTDDRQRSQDRRYRTIAERMRATNGRLDVDDAMTLLKNVAQPHTRWSAVYELRNGVMHYSLARDYTRRRTARLTR